MVTRNYVISEWIAVNKELGSIWREASGAHFHELPRYLTGSIEESDERPQFR
jgi:hypothetical protein